MNIRYTSQKGPNEPRYKSFLKNNNNMFIYVRKLLNYAIFLLYVACIEIINKRVQYDKKKILFYITSKIQKVELIFSILFVHLIIVFLYLKLIINF